ncbi:hypothetical protein VO54_01646 [Elizabethkingia miricola]|nr:hypothetical protein VO54_01646 [Elizabethkingia miricola]
MINSELYSLMAGSEKYFKYPIDAIRKLENWFPVFT